MKKRAVLLVFAMLFALLSATAAIAAEEDWKEAPEITGLYELEKERFFLEWEGNADLYQVYLDGKNVKTVNLNSAVIEMKAGRHQIQVVPVRISSKGVDTSVHFKVDGLDAGKIKLSEGAELDIDLAALGVDPKDVEQGSQSRRISLSYTVDPLYNAVPVIDAADTDFNDNVRLSFADKYDADIYRVTIKSGKDVNYVEFDTADRAAAALIEKNHSCVTVTLDRVFLKRQGCMAPDLGEKCSFSVTLEKYPVNRIDDTVETSVVHESKEGRAFTYTPEAAWKTAPEITYASQTADGEITLQWDHEDNGLGCSYEIRRIDRVLGVKKGETLLGTVSGKEFVIRDMMNGKVSFTVTPVLAREKGTASQEAAVEVKNSWVAAPSLTCEAEKDDQVRLTWTAAPGVESYHVTVYAGSGSLLRLVDLDYKKYGEFDVPAAAGEMEYLFAYGDDALTENGVRLKFEICGIRHTASGGEQRSAVSTRTIVVQ